MGRLFDRVWSVTVSTLDVSDFHVHFRIEKTTKPEPNKALVEIWNLSEDHRGALGEIVPGKRVAKKKKKKGQVSPNLTGKIPVRIDAGYRDDGPQQVFLGDLRTCDSEWSAPDWVTAITSGDGERAYRTARINQAFGAGVPAGTALKGLVTALGLGPGNVAQVAAGLKLGGTATLLARGAVFSGPVVRHLTDLCRSANLEWSVQDGVVQFVNLGQALAGKAVVLSAATGLIGSPNVDGDGVLKAECLMIPGLACGRLVIVDSKMVQGQFRVEKIVTEGDSHGKTWGHTIEAKRY
jgi:hypothetical protein